jgi:hypothetical protein
LKKGGRGRQRGREQQAARRGQRAEGEEPKHEVSLASARYRALRALDQSGLREPGLDLVWTVGSARKGGGFCFA